jgi:NAD(P)H-nitrite reductase large subunit
MCNNKSTMNHIVIIGNGISGVTAARHIRKNSDDKITIISAETKYFFSRTALMYVYMGHMKFEHTQPYENWFWEKNSIDLKEGFVENINTKEKILNFSNGENLAYNKLIIATGSKPNKFGWPGQDLIGVMGMYHKQDLEKLEKYAPDKKTCRRAVIVGGGLIGIELAEMLRSRNIPVTFLVRETSFWNGVLPAQESAMINEHIIEHHIDLRLKPMKTDV